jgi:hypothetical protein
MQPQHCMCGTFSDLMASCWDYTKICAGMPHGCWIGDVFIIKRPSSGREPEEKGIKGCSSLCSSSNVVSRPANHGPRDSIVHASCRTAQAMPHTWMKFAANPGCAITGHARRLRDGLGSLMLCAGGLRCMRCCTLVMTHGELCGRGFRPLLFKHPTVSAFAAATRGASAPHTQEEPPLVRAVWRRRSLPSSPARVLKRLLAPFA